MTLAEKLRFLADRAEDGKEFYWGDITMKFDSINVMVMEQIGEWVYSNIKFNFIDCRDIKLKPQWEFTEDEKVILRNLPDEFQWIARDKPINMIYVHTSKPTKDIKYWFSDNMTKLNVFKHLFKSIQWSDDEPCEFRKYI